MTIKSVTETFEFSYEEVQEALIQYLRSTNEIEPDEVVLSLDIPVALVDSEIDGTPVVVVDIEIAGDFTDEDN